MSSRDVFFFLFFKFYNSQNTICIVHKSLQKYVCVLPIFLFSYLVAKYSHHQLSSLVVLEHI